MSFLETVETVQGLLRSRRRLSFRVLRREFFLSDDEFEDLVEELVEQGVARREGSALVSIDGAADRDLAPTPAATSPLPETSERRQLTVMFCDIVGSTALSQRIDPEELRDLIGSFRAVCVEATKHYDGHVAQYLGDGVMIYFGYPQAHEDDAIRAVRAGLEIQRSLSTSRDSRQVETRIGIHTGLVVVDPSGSGDSALALGPTSNIAARIEGIAAPGTVLVSDATLALCRRSFVTESLGPKELKGVAAPLTVHRVDASSGVRSDRMTARDADKPMVGRERELGLLLDRWEEVQEGRGQVVLVSGEPGMGKSRLVRGLRDELAEARHFWVDLLCSPFTSGSAFQPLIDLFRAGPWLEGGESAEESLERFVGGLESLVDLRHESVIPYLLPLLDLPGCDRYPLPQISADEQRIRTLDALVQLNLTVSAQRPVVLVAEDLHWSDPSTREYLSRVIEQAPTTPILVVLTCRPDFRSPWTQSYVTEIQLARLSKQRTREIIESKVAARLPEPVLRQLETRSDGVPLYIEELLNGVVTSGVVSERGDRFEMSGSLSDLAIPTTLQDALMGRLDRLGASKRVAQQGATLGRTFSHALIEAVTDLDPPALRTALSQLVEAEIVYQRGVAPELEYTFKHALLQDTAYESQLLATRKTFHRRVVSVLEEHFSRRVESEPEMMARHCAAAGLTEKSIAYYQRAAGMAQQRLANEEAAGLLGLALDALTTLPESNDRHQLEISLRIALGKALMALDGYDAPPVLACFDRVQALCDSIGKGPEQLPGLIGLVQYAVAVGDVMRWKQSAEAILEISEPIGVTELIVTAKVLLSMVVQNTESALAGAKSQAEALALLDEMDFPPPATPYDIDLECVARIAYAAASIDSGSLATGLESLERINERLEALGDGPTDFEVATCRAMCGFMMHDPEFTRRAADEAFALSKGSGFHNAEYGALIYGGWARAMEGDVDEGYRDVSKGVEGLKATGAAGGLPMVLAVAAHTYRMAGAYEDAARLLDEASELADRTSEICFDAHVHLSRGLLLAETRRDELAAAEEEILCAIACADEDEQRQQALVSSVYLARLAERTGKLREARDRLVERLAAMTDGLDRPLPTLAKEMIVRIDRGRVG